MLLEVLVDPHIYPAQPGLPSEPSTSDDGVNYLRRLKEEVAGGAFADASEKSTGKAPTDPISLAWQQLRQSPRFHCSGSVRFRSEGNDAPVWGTLTDISLHGCYVEMKTTFPVDTRVDLVLKSFGILIQARGTVRTSYPLLGMGICFVEIEAGQEAQLKQLLDVLAGNSAVSHAGSDREDGTKNYMATVDLRAFLHEMTEFFRKNQTLGREEFDKIAKRVHRS